MDESWANNNRAFSSILYEKFSSALLFKVASFKCTKKSEISGYLRHVLEIFLVANQSNSSSRV